MKRMNNRGREVKISERMSTRVGKFAPKALGDGQGKSDANCYFSYWILDLSKAELSEFNWLKCGSLGINSKSHDLQAVNVEP